MPVRPAQSRPSILRLALLAVGLAVSGPAAALTGADLLNDVCLATFPRFDNASERIASFRPHAIDYDGRLFEQIEAQRRLSWTVNDGSDAAVDRFLVNVAWGTLQSLPAASCVVMDKRGFALAALKDKFAIKQIRVHPEKVLYTTFADAIAEGPDGRRLWLTLVLAPGHDDPGTGPAIAGATLMSSDYLNALMEKDR
jgi:hypothetical protein